MAGLAPVGRAAEVASGPDAAPALGAPLQEVATPTPTPNPTPAAGPGDGAPPAPTETPIAPVASLAATPTNGTATLTVDFTNTSTGSYTSSQWDFGDGGKSNKQNPTYRYKTPGVYSVSLTVSGPAGSSTATQPAYVTVCASTYADFEATPLSGVAPLTVAFTNRSCGAFSTWSWDMGDGTPASSDANPTHTYSAGGVYTVTLTATGASGTATKTKAGLVTVYDPLHADFSAQPSSGVAPLSVAFTNTSTGDYTASHWDFGDGGTSADQHPTHLYAAAGVYTVTLTASGPGGTDTRLMTDLVDVYPAIRDPGACNTDIAIQNLGAQAAQGSVLFATAGQDYLAWAAGLGPLAPKALQPLPFSQFGGDAAGSWAGATDVASSQPVAAAVTMLWNNPATGTRAAATYSGVASPTTAAYLPLLATAPGYRTDLTVQNTAQTQASVTIRFYDRAGTPATKAITVPAGSETTLDLTQVPEASFSATSGLGAAEITADRAIAVVAAVHWPHASDAYSAPGAGATTLLAPGMVRKLNADGSYDWSELIVQNTGDAATSVQVEFISQGGTLTHTLDRTIPAHGAASYSTRELAELDDGWQGTVKVTSTNGQPLAAVSVAWLPSTGAADNLAWNAVSDATAGPLAFPAVYRQLAGEEGDRWSAVCVHSAAATAGTLSVEFYDEDGAKVGATYTVAVPAGGLARLSLKDGLDLPQAALSALGTGFSGSLWVTPSAGLQIAGVAQTVWPAEGRAAGYAGFAAP